MENEDIYRHFAGWLTNAPSLPSSTRSKFCKENPVSLGNMGVNILQIHAASKKHQEIVKTMSKIRSFLFSNSENNKKLRLILLTLIQEQILMRKTLEKLTRKVVI